MRYLLSTNPRDCGMRVAVLSDQVFRQTGLTIPLADLTDDEIDEHMIALRAASDTLELARRKAEREANRRARLTPEP